MTLVYCQYKCSMLWTDRLYTLAHHENLEDERVYRVFPSNFRTSFCLVEQVNLMWSEKQAKRQRQKSDCSDQQGFIKWRRVDNIPWYSAFVSEQCFLLHMTSLSIGTSAKMPEDTRLAAGSSMELRW